MNWNVFLPVCVCVNIVFLSSNSSPPLESRQVAFYSDNFISVLSWLPLAFSFLFSFLLYFLLLGNLEINFFMSIALSLCANSRSI